MENERLFDINEVCKMLGTTSRTLRFYEEKGIVKSTRSDSSNRRQYTKEQIDHICNVTVLRTLGLSVKAIAELQNQETDLKKAVLSKRAEIFASIKTREKEIRLLNEALAVIEAEEDIFEKDFQKSSEHSFSHIDKIVKVCTEAIVGGNSEKLYQYFSIKLVEYLPLSAYESVRKDVLEPLGEFVSFERIEHDSESCNCVYCFVKYARLGLKIKFVFHNERISGLWMSYYEISEGAEL